ncbi:MAG TPA: mycofactocin-associated electron transfer flavoprotein beta subunit [Acidimicrobiales bacterium]|nr:mycofactocin-associated electron transfer flavoprotein beta subunit [Acidimicrobiales bacterium]
MAPDQPPAAPLPPGSPLVVACVRFADLRPDVDPLTGAITRDVHRAGLSAADEAAVEHALRIADAWSARVLVVTAGPPAADDPLREMLALGCQVLRIPWPADGGGDLTRPADGRGLGSAQSFVDDVGGDERAVARAVAVAVRSAGRPALVICGDRSADRGTGAFPAFVAHELGAAQALGLVDLRPDAGGVLAERRLDGGRRERLRVPQPAVCSVEGAGVRLRRASLPGTLAAGRAAVPTVAGDMATGGAVAAGMATGGAVAGDMATGNRTGPVAMGPPVPYRPRTRVIPPPDGAARQRLLSLTGALAAHEPPTIIGPVEPSEAADALLAFLARHGYLDDDRAGPSS